MPLDRYRIVLPEGLNADQIREHCAVLLRNHQSETEADFLIRSAGLSRREISRLRRAVDRDLERYHDAVQQAKDAALAALTENPWTIISTPVLNRNMLSNEPGEVVYTEFNGLDALANNNVNDGRLLSMIEIMDNVQNSLTHAGAVAVQELKTWYTNELASHDERFSDGNYALCDVSAGCFECNDRTRPRRDRERMEALEQLNLECNNRLTAIQQEYNSIQSGFSMRYSAQTVLDNMQVSPTWRRQSVELDQARRYFDQIVIAAEEINGIAPIINSRQALTAEEIAANEQKALELKLKRKQEKEERMGRIKDIKTLVVNGKAADLHRLIRCGFELETQESKGLTQESRQVDEQLYEMAVKEQAGYILQDKSYVLRCLKETGISVDNFNNYINERTGRVKDALRNDLSPSEWQALWNAAEVYARQNINRREYQMSPEKMFDELTMVEAGTDGSVAGFEFRTMGPNSIVDFKKAAREIFKIKHEIDEKCSFHIHLSVDGLEHSYGETLQLLLMEGVLKQADKVPATVLSRWRRGFRNETVVRWSDIGNYFKWTVNHDKYVAVSKHTEYDTWEFRCFGNVQSYKDAKQCLKIAINALKYAYERQLVRGGPVVLTAENCAAVAKEISNLSTWDDMIEKYGDHAELHAA